MSAEFEYKTIAKFNNMYVYIYNKISGWINNNYNINCSGLHRDAILNRLLFTKTEEEFNDLYNRFLCAQTISFNFINITNHRKYICQDLMNTFNLKLVGPNVDFRSSNFTFEIDRENFETLYGLCRMM